MTTEIAKRIITNHCPVCGVDIKTLKEEELSLIEYEGTPVIVCKRHIK